MRITFDQLNRLIRPSPELVGLGACQFELRVLTLDDVLAAITCWDKVSSIADYAMKTPPTDKVAAYTENFPSGPVLVVAFTLTTLGRVWPALYDGRSGDQLVVLEGNNRLTALARRRAAGIVDDILVMAFVGEDQLADVGPHLKIWSP